jgi:hypothetical protein
MQIIGIEQGDRFQRLEIEDRESPAAQNDEVGRPQFLNCPVDVDGGQAAGVGQLGLGNR